ncbi:MAG: hypothetical protein Q9174_001498 [Haloplaca sp. 1 TL-2023]
MADNQQHLERRRQVNEFYTTKAINSLAYRVDHVTRIFLARLAQKATSDLEDSWDICQTIRFYAYDALANLTFGQAFGYVDNDSDVNGLIEGVAGFLRYGMTVGSFAEWHDIIIRIVQALLPDSNKALLPLINIGQKAIESMDISKSSVDGPEKSGSPQPQKPHSFVGLLQDKHPRDPSSLDRDDVIYHMIPNIVAGADTSSAGLNAAIYLLWRNPRVLNKLRAELDAWAESRGQRPAENIISITEAQELAYLQAVLKETLRVFPGLGINLVRTVPEGGMMILNHFFPAGTTVGMNAFVAHANREVFGDDASDFRPERWLGDAERVTQMDEYFLSFGRGPRSCVGKNIALLLLNTLIPELVLRFDFEPADPGKEWTVYDDVFMYQSDFHVKVRQRTKPDTAQPPGI